MLPAVRATSRLSLRPAGLFSGVRQKPRDHFFSLWARPVHFTPNAQARFAVGANEHGAGEHPHFPGPRDVASRVKQHRQAHARGSGKLRGLGSRLLVVDGQHRELVGPIDFGKLLQGGHFGAAWLTPTRPEVDDNRAATKLGQAPGFAVEVVRLQAGCGQPCRPTLDLVGVGCLRRSQRTRTTGKSQVLQESSPCKTGHAVIVAQGGGA